jgi:hypothetical protein
MRDEQQRHAVLAHEFLEQCHDFRLHHHVERAGRLVGDEQLRPRRDRRGDANALPLAAGKLVRIGAQGCLGLRNADALQKFLRTAISFEPAHAEMPLIHFGNLLADRQHGIEARPRVLENEAIVAAWERCVAEYRPCDPAGDCRIVRQQSGES